METVVSSEQNENVTNDLPYTSEVSVFLVGENGENETLVATPLPNVHAHVANHFQLNQTYKDI